MEILIHDGKREIMLCGEDAIFEIRHKSKHKNKDTGEVKMVWVPVKWFSSFEGVCKYVMQLKVTNSEANSFAEVIEAIREAQRELKWPI